MKMWLSLKFGFLLLVLVFLPGTGRAHTLIPTPGSVIHMPGHFVLSNETAIVSDDPDVGGMLAASLNLPTGPQGMRVIRLRRVEAFIKGSGEGYRITISTNGINIESATAAGLFAGSRTLIQLLPQQRPVKVQNQKIEDAPRFAWRGLMVDVARNFIEKDALMRIIDEMATYKLNVLHLHLTDDPGWRIEIPGYPKLTEIGAKGGSLSPGTGAARYYTANDIREIVAFAARRFIMVVPEIEMPGHAAAAARSYPEYFDGNKSFNPGNPQTYVFIRDVLTEIVRLFPSPYLHFGGDELRDDRWDDLEDVSRLKASEQLGDRLAVEGYFDRKVVQIIQELGKKPMAWDEVVTAGVGSDVLVQWWRKLQPEVRDNAIANGYEVILSPADQVYFDYPQGPGEPGAPWEGNDNGPTSLEKVLAWEPVPAHFTADEAKKIRGVEAAIWTEFIASESYLQFMLYPRLQAFAEIAWSTNAERNPQVFKRRLEPHLERLEKSGYRFRRNPEDAYEFMIH